MLTFFKAIAQVILLPGTLVLRWIGIDIEQDGGILRSFVNMCFWTAIGMWIAIEYFI
ncbi:hypothetical protein [Nitratireductor arenosus]|uniref:hypothetical protein n=1 Tax=Nitratireductor arenosus TaxID=2682096 RepID=UPI0018D26154|nr:hypothetical protein [Nitratireductor arenosus]